MESSVESRVLEVADRQAKRLKFLPSEYERKVTKQKNTYIVEYFHKDQNRLGGGIEIWIDANTLKVIRKIYTQ